MSNIKKILTLAKKIKQARKDSALSQKELAKALKLSDKAISAYEVGRSSPSLKTLKSISKITDKPISYFLDDKEAEELDLEIKIRTIEKELSEIKKILQKSRKNA
ncbi:MAG: helix-turn-helix transcriptional regulator [Candidatus Woesebacteria bacterium]|jgi:repressor LexA